MYTVHAKRRQQQRNIPKYIQELLINYGQYKYTGEKGKIYYFNKVSLRKIIKDLGKNIQKDIDQYLNAYLVRSSDDQVLITVGRRYKNKRIKDK